MTKRKHLKRLVRSRAATTGESYAVALRNIRQHRPEDRMSATAASTEKPIASCSFCNKPNTTVKSLIAGPGVFICNECVELSATIVADVAHTPPEESARLRAQFVNRSAEEILEMLPAVARSASQIEAALASQVRRLREMGTDWQQIAGALGTSADAARQRFEAERPV